MKTKKPLILLMSLSILSSGLINKAKAQTDSTYVPNSPQGGGEKMLLAGEVFTIWQNNKLQGVPSNNTFGADPLGLMIMPLVKLTDRLFLDVQAEVDANPGVGLGGGASVSLNEAIIYYHLASGVNIFAGNFQPRSGLYEGILDDFTNRYGTEPIGMGIGSATQSGIGIQGGIQCGYSKLLYQLYVANGPRLLVDSTGATNGQMDYGNYTDNNQGKAIGGEIGLLPFSNSSLELGVSGQYTPTTGDAGSPFENISNSTFAGYINYYHTFNPLMVRLQGQYEYTQTKSFSLDSTATTPYVASFKNQMSGWYAGITLRLSGSDSRFLSNLEMGGRLGQLTYPKDALWGAANPWNQTTVCLTYWYTWKTPINIAYDIISQSGSPTQASIVVRGMWFF